MGRTQEAFFNEAFTNPVTGERYKVPPDIAEAAVRICQSYGINGICDPMYICNVIAAASNRGDGQGNFYEVGRLSPKHYKCDACGCVVVQETNHYGPTWSVGHHNICPNCPPFKKYPEFGGHTSWTCIDRPCLPERP